MKCKKTAWDLQMDKIEAIFVEKATGFYKFAYSILKNESEARDVVQEAYKNLLKKMYSDPDFSCHNPEGYLVSIIGNEAKMRFRKMERERGSVPIEDCWELEDVDSNTGEQVDCLLEKEALRVAVARLPERYKAYIRLKFYEEREDEEIAGIMGTKLESIRKLRERALQKLRELMKGCVAR